MAITSLLDTKTLSLNEILGNGKIYRVPAFQRDYSWEQDNWEDLWNDLVTVYQTGNPHYMGSIVLQISGNEDDKEYLVIDGQQRFTTLSLLILSVIRKIKNLADSGVETTNNLERIEILMRDYIGKKDPSSLLYSSKLFLNENNDGFYQQRLLNFRSPVNYSKLSDSEKLLWDAYIFFNKQIDILFPNNLTNGGEVTAFLSKSIGEQLKFIQITVRDELNAYTVFETLNSRGIDLTSTDLLKNYIFSLVAKSSSDLSILKGQWKKIIDSIGLKEFPIFLRHYLNARSSLVTKDRLFKSQKHFVKTDQNVFDLLGHLEGYSYTYNALFNSEDELWGGDKEVKDLINSLNLFRVTLCHSLLMVAYDKLSLPDFKKVLSAVVTISFRYNVIGKLQTNDMEKAYNKIANKVYSGSFQQVQQIINDLKILYINDDNFRNYFTLKMFNTTNSQQKKIARYILYKIESYLAGGVNASYDLDDGTIEHILPENMDEDWSQMFSDEEHSRNVYMLGNLTLLEPSKNGRDAAQKIMKDKIEVYKTSKFALSNEITATDWTVKMIQHRQMRLAKIATGIWKIQ
ncbi:DUF262 domain-containing protein [Larkinella punicea]|uniref:DUF262 domain-containing protein n=1 Tax=Larkinella punicea TaxID=2315727 RepID=A0A368JQA7_9BACT|nr:DUF262 domain-containing protein [Larkinella punicea]RCR69505.1 DUF262 domain-containing protein [Larkinella punicea]